MWMAGVVVVPDSDREGLMFEVWARRRLVEVRRLRFEQAIAIGKPEDVAAAAKEILRLLSPGMERQLREIEKKNKRVLEKYKNRPFVVRTFEDENDRLTVELEAT